MSIEYVVEAYSPSLNQTVREFQLSNNANVSITSEAIALQHGQSFAQRMNNKQHMSATDWVAKVTLQELGIQTLPNYLFHTGS